MSKAIEKITLSGSNAGTERTLAVHRYGQPGARPKTYVQASLHADEIPGMLTAHHLIRRLDAIDAKGGIEGEVIVVPVANPIGLDQHVNDSALGRFALGGAGNFNRHYPDLTPKVAEKVRDRLTDDPNENVAIVRRALVEALSEAIPVTEVDHLRHALLGMAIDADIVLDLHCDDQALFHVYLGTPLWPEAQDLAHQLGSEIILLAEISGGEPFDEACSSPWWRLREHLGDDIAVPPSCLASTVELRGNADVDDETAASDADNIVRFLQRRSVVAGDPGPLPAPLTSPTPLAGVEMVKAPASGIVAYRVTLGDRVKAGDVIAEIVDPTAPVQEEARTLVRAATDGPVWARRAHRYVRAGDVIAKIAGPAPLEGKGSQLLTA